MNEVEDYKVVCNDIEVVSLLPVSSKYHMHIKHFSSELFILYKVKSIKSEKKLQRKIKCVDMA